MLSWSFLGKIIISPNCFDRLDWKLERAREHDWYLPAIEDLKWNEQSYTFHERVQDDAGNRYMSFKSIELGKPITKLQIYAYLIANED